MCHGFNYSNFVINLAFAMILTSANVTDISTNQDREQISNIKFSKTLVKVHYKGANASNDVDCMSNKIIYNAED